MRPTIASLLLPATLLAASLLAACQGCRSTSPSRGPAGQTAAKPTTPPTVRLYLMSTVAGALEPCGCSKNQLGGFDHLGAFLASERASAPSYLLAAAGPLFFLDPTPRGDQATQDEWKADAIADALSRTTFAAWSPGANDWQDGAKKLGALGARARTTLVASNLAGDVPGAAPSVVVEQNGVKVGFVGVSVPIKLGVPPPGVEVKPPPEQLKTAIAAAKSAGANVLVGLFAMPRGDALRLAESAPELSVVVVGKPFDQGEANDKASPPVILGKTLVVQPANHLQTLAIVDLHVRGGSFDFQDAAGVSRTSERDALTKRIEELRVRIRAWEQDPKISAQDLDARRADLTRAVEDLAALESPTPPSSGSFFRYTMQEIRGELGIDKPIRDTMLSFYQRVNDHNREAFQDRKPPPPGPDGNKFIGVDACGMCHPPAKQVWLTTQHAHAYATLESQHKEFNLDCVSCHVTGYEKPGGSTVTGNAKLQNVGCEECHGPGEKHRLDPHDKTAIVAHPKPETCVSSCHHSPHVEGFDPVAQMHRILGPGHGHVEEWPPRKNR